RSQNARVPPNGLTGSDVLMNATLTMNAIAAERQRNASAPIAMPASVAAPVAVDGAFASRAAGMDMEGDRLQNIPHASLRVRVPQLWPPLRISDACRAHAELPEMRERRTGKAVIGVCGRRRVGVEIRRDRSRRVRHVRGSAGARVLFD